MTVQKPQIYALLVLVSLALSAPVRAEEAPGPNRSQFRYVDEKRPVRVYPVPPPTSDPTGLTLDEMRERAIALEERVERLEQTVARLLAERAAQPQRERRP